MMSVHSESQDALQLLERLQEKLNSKGDVSDEQDLAALIHMLESPLFNQLLTIQDSIAELKRYHQSGALIHADDFDFCPESGDLIVSEELQSRLETGEGPSGYENGEPLTENEEIAYENETYDMVAATPMYEEKPFDPEEFEAAVIQMANDRDTLVIDLFKPENASLGFSVVGLKSESRGELGIFVQEIQPDGLAARDGRLQESDQILAINEQLLDAKISHQDAIRILQGASGQVELVVARGSILSSGGADDPDKQNATSGESYSDMLNTEWTQLEVIDLQNDGSGLGFGIIGGKSTGVVVKTILPGGVADRDGRLHSGDHLLQIGDINVRGMGSEQVASVLRQSGSHVRLVVARSISDPPAVQNPIAPIIPTQTLDEHLQHLFMSDSIEHLEYGYDQTQLDDAVQLGFVEEAEVYAPPPDHFNDSETELFDVDLLKDNQGLGITIAGYVGENPAELSGIFVKSVTDGSPADVDGRIRVNDQIIQVDGRSLEGFTNFQAVEVLKNTGQAVKLKVVRYRKGPKYEQLQLFAAQAQLRMSNTELAHQTSINIDDIALYHPENEDYSGELTPDIELGLKTRWQVVVGDEYDIVVAQLSKFREGGGLGISLEGTVDVENGIEVRPHHYIRSVLNDGPVGLNGRLQSGDELLEVNGHGLYGLNHVEVVTILKELPQHVRIVCARRKLAQSDLLYAHTGDPTFFQPSQNFSPSHEATDSSESGGGGAGSVSTDRLVKAKSEQSLATPAAADITLNKGKSRSLEPLTGLAMWSSEPVVIELQKAERGLGFSILDYQDPMNPAETVIVIRSLVPGGVAQLDGQLVPGDRLIFVNEINVEHATLDQAVQALKGAPKGIVHIGVAKPLPVPDSFLIDEQDENSLPSLPSTLPPDAAYRSLRQEEEIKMNITTTTGVKPQQATISDLKASPSSSPQASPSSSPNLGPRWTIYGDIPPLPSALERSIKIAKGTDKIGFVLDAVDKGRNGGIIKSIAKGQTIDRDGRLKVGDHVVSINNESLRNMTNSQVRQILRRVALISGEISLSYIPATDAAVHRESALIAMREQGVPSSPSLQPSPKVYPKYYRSKLIHPSQFVKHSGTESSDEEHGLTSPQIQQKTSVFLTLNNSTEEEEVGEDSRTKESSTDPDINENNNQANIVNDLPITVIAQNETDDLHKTESTVMYANNIQGVEEKYKITTPTMQNVKHVPRERSLSLDKPAAAIRAESWGPPRLIELEREAGQSLGISIVGGKVDLCNSKETAISGIFIKQVIQNSPAGRNGTLKTGDRILEVDSHNVRDSTHDEAVEIIRNASNPVSFLVQSLLDRPCQPPDEVSYVSSDEESDDLTTTIVKKKLCKAKPLANHCKITQQDSNATTGSSQPDESESETEEEDEFGYTRKSIHKKYGDLNGSLHLIELERGQNGLGLSLAGNKDLNMMSIFIVGIVPNSPVGRDGRIQVGDELLEINGQVLYGRSHLNASAIIKGVTLPTVKIILLRRDDFLNHMAVKPLTPAQPAKYDDDEPSTADTTIPSIACLAGYDLSPYKDIKSITLEKTNMGLGFAIQENYDDRKGIFVKSINLGPAAEGGQLKSGDQLLCVDETPVIGVHYDKAIEILRKAQGTVNLTINSDANIVIETTTPTTPQSRSLQHLSQNQTEQEEQEFTISFETENSPDISRSESSSSFVSDDDFSTDAEFDVMDNGDYNSVAIIIPDKIPDPDQRSNQEEKRSISNVTTTPNIQGDPATCVISPGHETVIEIQKGKSGLGLSIVGGSDTLLGAIIIHEVYEDGAAAKDGRLWAGDQILEVNGDDLREASHDRAIQVLRQTPPVVRMIVLRDDAQVKDEDFYDVFTVELMKKPNKGLGLSIVGKKNDVGVFISDIVKGGVAEADGRLMQGDQILAVNGEDMKGVTQDYAATVLKTLMGKVTLVIGRLKISSRSSSRRNSSNASDRGLKKSESSASNVKNKGKHPKGNSNVSGSSQGSHKMTRIVHLVRDMSGSLGLSIAGGHGSPLGNTPVIIASMSTNGPAAKSKNLMVGDHIVAINSVSTENLSQTQAANLLVQAKGTVTLEVTPGDPQHRNAANDSFSSQQSKNSNASNRGHRKIASSADEEEDHDEDLGPPEVKIVNLRRGPAGLGFSIVGGYGSPHGDLPIYVKTVFAQGAAAECGDLHRGDQILAVNGQPLDGATHDDAVNILKNSTGIVTLTIMS
ncbi:multiple PDZ domain protein-like isoform X4 [Tubulanus polymorphus]|uniref:multiple PDZ domain protein-like isoform X4 n=1 Tax=Tubulanus polymorphus TaxID=672921 RepID=UPI003DA55A3D